MTAQRRNRRHSPVPDQQERLRALALDSSPAARRLRARIPRPPAEPVPPVEPAPPSGGDPTIPSAPYAVVARAPYRPPDPGSTPSPNRDARPPGALFRGRAAGPPEAAVPSSGAAGPPGSARPAALTGERSAPRAGARAAAPAPERGRAEGRHRSPERPSPEYAEFDPRPPDSLLERLARRWAPEAALSRRAVLALIVLGALAVALVLVLHDRPTTVAAPEAAARAVAADHPAAAEEGGATEAAEGSRRPEAAADAELIVHVGGEVEDPGLYTLPSGARIADAVEAAGGALPEADLDLLNLARPLVDGEQVLVGVPQPAGAAGAGPEAGGPVDVNRADRALLETLPGIGPVIADNIIAHREEHGPFASVDELVNVNKIGEKMLDSLRDHVTVG